MVDRVSAVSRSKLGRRIGVLEAETMQEVGKALMIFLDLAESSRASGL